MCIPKSVSARRARSGEGTANPYAVAARVYAELRRCRDAADEEKQSIQGVERNHDDRREGQVLFEGGRYQVQQRQHREDGHEHVVVNDGGVAGEGGCDHVADERQDEQRPEELWAVRVADASERNRAAAYLETPQGQVDD